MSVFPFSSIPGSSRRGVINAELITSRGVARLSGSNDAREKRRSMPPCIALRFLRASAMFGFVPCMRENSLQSRAYWSASFESFPEFFTGRAFLLGLEVRFEAVPLTSRVDVIARHTRPASLCWNLSSGMPKRTRNLYRVSYGTSSACPSIFPSSSSYTSDRITLRTTPYPCDDPSSHIFRSFLFSVGGHVTSSIISSYGARPVKRCSIHKPRPKQS
mmetsp:Transcript_2120/g.5607  ORF Transcript_2120/g.5607 Transcript_2120/m.5607 type:complete len:217 (-) Transcript_2120:4076-4726(-)